jgi:lipopolysaccharide export system protein LptC
MSRQNWLIGLLFILALGVWRWFDQGNDPSQDKTGAIYQPSFTTRELRTQHYDANGSLKEELTADYAEHYIQLDMSELEQPRIITRDASGHPLWELSGEKGVINKSDSVILRNNVILKSLSPDPVVNHLNTEYMELDLTNQQVRTNLKVVIDGPGFHNEGTGLLGKLDQNSYELLDNSHAIYFNQAR